MTYIKIGEQLIQANVSGLSRDRNWNDRASMTICCMMSYAEAINTFVDDVKWSVVYKDVPYQNEKGETVVPEPIETDYSDYSVAGSVTDNRDGTVIVRMGKPTEVESLKKQLANAVTEEELEAAYVEGVNSL